jgi:acyl-CoA dehydrogenase
MEVFLKYGTDEQKNEWLDPLLNGDIRSAFLMTEPFVASSDATNIECSIQKDGDDYVINGRKWWSSGAGDERCKIFILMGKTAPSNPNKYEQQSMILVPKNTPGVKVLRPLHIFGYNDVPEGHMEIELDNVRVPAKNILLGEGRGFEIAQGRLGPGRIHHCMRIIGQAERALEMMCKRLKSRVAFGKAISEQSIWHDRIAESRILINQSRLLTLNAAHMMDTVGNKQAKAEIAMIKVAAPMMAQKVIDWAIQAHGGGGVSQEFKLAFMYSWNRVMRLVDGPDEVHKAQIAKIELRKH